MIAACVYLAGGALILGVAAAAADLYDFFIGWRKTR